MVCFAVFYFLLDGVPYVMTILTTPLPLLSVVSLVMRVLLPFIHWPGSVKEAVASGLTMSGVRDMRLILITAATDHGVDITVSITKMSASPAFLTVSKGQIESKSGASQGRKGKKVKKKEKKKK